MAQHDKAKDPVSQAMLAIEDALNLGLEPQGALPAQPSEPAPPAVAAPQAPVPPPAAPKPEPLLPPPEAVRRPSETAGPRLTPPERPANDDRAAARPIVQALQIQRPSLAPFVAAAVVSTVWFALCAYYGYERAPDYLSAPQRIFRPETALFFLSALAPAMLIFGFALLVRRLAELRQSAATIAHVAVRLAEPEAMAREQFSSLAQAIRREVSSMGDGVERAFTRATELEALVRKETAALERSSGEHERRLRTLISDLADQRETLVVKSEAVRLALVDAHDGPARELQSIGDRLVRTVNEIGEAANASLTNHTDQFALAIERFSADGAARLVGVGDKTARDVAESAANAAALLIAEAERLDETVRTRGDALVQELSRRHDEIDRGLAESTDRVTQAIRSEGLGVVVQLETAAHAAAETIASHSDELVARIVASGDDSVTAIRSHGDSVADRLASSGAALARDLVENGERLVNQVESSRRNTSESLIAQAQATAAQVSQSHDEIARAFETNSDVLLSRLAEASASTSVALESHAQLTIARIGETHDAVTRDFEERQRSLTETFTPILL